MYSINGGDNITLIGLNGTINQEIWENAIEGNVNITFYAQDRAGNIEIRFNFIMKEFYSYYYQLNQ